MTEPLRILGKGSSINVRKVLWTCREAGNWNYSRCQSRVRRLDARKNSKAARA